MGPKAKMSGAEPFDYIEKCSSDGREKQTVISDLDGTLVRGRSSFPYFMLVAFEAGGFLRSLLLLLFAPIAWFLYHFVSEAAGIQVLIFVTFAGLKVTQIETVARAVLPKFYCEDLHPETWRVFSSFGKRYVLTASPRIMVETFATEYLGADVVLGSEIEVTRNGRATGFLKAPGVLVGVKKENCLKATFGDEAPDVGLGDRKTDHPFMALCKEGYVVPANKVQAVQKEKLPKPIVFHDGRLVQRPTPLNALLTLVWMPIGFLLAVLRIAAASLLPMSLTYYAFVALGVRVKVTGTPPPAVKDGKQGVLFICSHRTLLDPIFLSIALRRPITAVTYSISRVSEALSPIKTVALSRNREQDAANISKLLEEGDLAICQREQHAGSHFFYDSQRFCRADGQDHPRGDVQQNVHVPRHDCHRVEGHGSFLLLHEPKSCLRGYIFEPTAYGAYMCGWKTSVEVANYIQRVIAGTLNFQCTNFTRRDKYKVLAGNDGSVPGKTTFYRQDYK